VTMGETEPTRPFRDAEAWLAERGVRRERVTGPPAPPSETPAGFRARDGAPPVEPTDGIPAGAPPPIGVREAARLAWQSAADTAAADTDRRSARVPPHPSLEDEVAAAVAFVRRSTVRTPQAEARLADKLRARGHPATVVVHALDRARREQLVDDPAMVAALVEEGAAKGHAPARIRMDLARRGFGPALVDEALQSLEQQDLGTRAFALARRRAETAGELDAEAAYRRVAAYVARRGYPEALARKAARDAVFAAREAERTAGR